jgi:hypothetical protein
LARRHLSSVRVALTALLTFVLYPDSSVLALCPEDTRFYMSRRDVVPPAQNPFFVHALATGDFNGDGREDLVLAHIQFGEDVKFAPQILVNDGTGGFVDATSQVLEPPTPTLWHSRRIAVRDFNGDGRDDIFIAAHGIDRPPFPGEPNKLLLSTPNGKLVDASDRIPQLNDYSHALAVGDIDGDGDLDLVVGNFACGEKASYVLLNDGHGNLTMDRTRLPSQELCVGCSFGKCEPGNMGSLLLVDVNHDGALDLVVGDHRLDVSRVYLNDGRGFFRDSARLDLPDSRIGGDPVFTVDIQAADLDRDGHIDLILSQTRRDPLHYLGRKIQILMGDGTGHFRDETDSRIPAAYLFTLTQGWYLFLYVVDFNRDGYPDIVVSMSITGGADLPSDTPYVFVNDGRGRFSPLTASVFGPRVDRLLGPLVPIDADGDGGLDFFAAGFYYELFKQQTPYSDCTPLARAALSGTQFKPGDTITIGFAAQNPADGPAADLVAGAVLADGKTAVWFSDIGAIGGTGDVSAAASFGRFRDADPGATIYEPEVFRFTFPPGFSGGIFQVFAALVRRGALVDDRIDPGDILAVDVRPFSLAP